MIKVEFERQLYSLRFMHNRQIGMTVASLDPLPREKGEKAKETGIVGMARCHPMDNYCKETGRRIALNDLTSSHKDVLPKEFRAEIWKAYWNRPKGGGDKTASVAA